ncbi:glycosyltransferase family 4 protein [Lactobacillus delbrueckii]|uniref:glycosyltransferase family 4 protein n=1 Tax=Lactobacillus delbrueckii TaxID=1584 RepID=UPI001E440AB6|nr:glycosyltransferase family 4 protein [Lactobacillus delbrueckii]MCD5504899.1 glycosyltransferase family 4 protein [Lactobacillus delbrueckii subsp. lactis]
MSKVKNIAFVVPFLPKRASGGVLVILQYAERLAALGNTVTLYFQANDTLRKLKIPMFVRKKVTEYRLTYAPDNWYPLNKRIKKVAIQSLKDVKKHDAIIATGLRTSFFVKKLPAECGKKFYFIQDFENWGGFTDKDVLDSYQLGLDNIVISNWLSEIVTKVSAKRPKLIKDGIDTELFKVVFPVDKRNTHSVILQYRGDSEPIKGGKYALDVVRKLKDKYPDLKVKIVSREPKTNKIPDWCEYLYNLPLKDVVVANNQASVFICTSIEEGFGLPGLEAMACGCVLCTTDYRGGREYAVHRQNSMVSPVKDVDAMVKNISEVFSDNELREKISINGIRTANNMSLKKSCDKFTQYILENI